MSTNGTSVSKSVARSKPVTSKAAKPTKPRTPRSKPQAIDKNGDAHLRRVAALIPPGVAIVEHVPPRPETPDVVSLAHEATVGAIDAFIVATAEANRIREIKDETYDRTHDLLDGDPEANRRYVVLERLAGKAMSRYYEAARHLADLVRLWDDVNGTGDVKSLDRDPYPNRGYAYRGKLYLAVVQDDFNCLDEQDVDFRPSEFGLRVVDLRRIVEAPSGEIESATTA